MAPNIQFLILLFGISIPVGYAKSPNRIVNGRNAPHTPYQVSLFTNNVHFCGGSIIDERHIITAAHCVISDNGQTYPMWVLAGTNDHKNRNQNNVYRVVRTFIHTDYSPYDSWRNDIALLKVDRHIIFNQYQHSILLPGSNTPVGTVLTLTGWGQTRRFRVGAEQIPRYLRTININVINLERCRQLMGRPRMTEGQICTWTGGQGGACKYDSGGPLVDGNVLVGIASFGDLSCKSMIPEVFTRVYRYVPWIRAIIAQSRLIGD